MVTREDDRMDQGEGQVDQGWTDPKMKNWWYRNTRPIWYKWDPVDKEKAGRLYSCELTAIGMFVSLGLIVAVLTIY